jgi:hypothetical protein
LRALGLLGLLRRGGISHLHGQPLPLFGKDIVTHVHRHSLMVVSSEVHFVD